MVEGLCRITENVPSTLSLYQRLVFPIQYCQHLLKVDLQRCPTTQLQLSFYQTRKSSDCFHCLFDFADRPRLTVTTGSGIYITKRCSCSPSLTTANILVVIVTPDAWVLKWKGKGVPGKGSEAITEGLGKALNDWSQPVYKLAGTEVLQYSGSTARPAHCTLQLWGCKKPLKYSEAAARSQLPQHSLPLA